MLSAIGSYSTKRLQTFQRVLDLIWMELQANGNKNYIGPSDPDALRKHIARRVFDLYDGGEAHSDKIAAIVLRSFGVQPPDARSQNNGSKSAHRNVI